MGAILLESGDRLLLESGFALLDESGPSTVRGYVTLTLDKSAPTHIGDRAVWTAAFFTDADVAIDPDSVFFRWRTPDGTETSFEYGTDDEIERTGTGVYAFLAPTIAAAGPHTCRALSLAGLVVSAESRVSVVRTPFTNP